MDFNGTAIVIKVHTPHPLTKIMKKYFSHFFSLTALGGVADSVDSDQNAPELG